MENTNNISMENIFQNEAKTMGFNLNYECEEYPIETLLPNDNHTILFDHNSLKCHDHVGSPDPLPIDEHIVKWNNEFVKMPFSQFNLDQSGEHKWKKITKYLLILSKTLTEDPDSIHIEQTIKRINDDVYTKWGFRSLHDIFNNKLEATKSEAFLKETFPKIIKLALDLPNIMHKAIPILKANKPHSITMSQEQCACILANAFFCTFPMRDEENPENMPYFNFFSLLNVGDEKLRCIIHYFERVTTKMPTGTITFTRKCLKYEQIPSFINSKKQFRKAIVCKDGTIEDCPGALQMDFANKYIGGGVLNYGCVQEEIRFVICPELLVSLLFTEVMESNESVIIKGSERFSSYTGYAQSFKWKSDYIDESPRDGWKRLYNHVLAIDALKFSRNPAVQFNEKNVERELIKCFCGFQEQGIVTSEKKSAIATGNWGCGAFRGNIELKFLIQMMAAAETDRDLIYFTFDCQKTNEKLLKIIEIIKKFKLNVGQLFIITKEYEQEVQGLKKFELDKFSIGVFMEHALCDQYFRKSILKLES